MKEDIYTYKEFTAYLLIYAGFADLELSEKEKAKIIEMVGNDDFNHILDLYYAHSDIESIHFIQDQATYFIESPSDKKVLLDEMRDVILQDGAISNLEEEFVKVIGKLI